MHKSKLSRVLELDRSTLAQLQEPDRFVVTHCRTVPGLEPIPGIVITDIPRLVSAVGVHGKEVHFARIDDLPEEAAREKEIFRRFGPQSSAIFPFKVGGKIIGAMAFGSVLREREWTDDVVNRLRLLVEIIGNAIARTRVEERTREALEENRRLRQRLERENACLQQEAKAVRGRARFTGESPALRY